MMLIPVVLALSLGAGGNVTLDYRGTLGEALNQIATQGDLSLIATGELKVDAEVHLKDISAEAALESLARVHHLEVHREGKLWVIKPEGSVRAGAATPPLAPAPPVAPMPPLPPLPPAAEAAADLPGPGATAEELQSAAEAARERAEEASDRAEEALDRARDLREAELAHARAVTDEAKARVEEAKANAEARVNTGPVVIKAGEHTDAVVAYGGGVTLEKGAVVDGDAVAFGGDVVLGEGALIDGDAVSFGGVVKKGPGSVVKGQEVSFGSRGFGVKAANRALTMGPMATVSKHDDEAAPAPGSRVGQFLLQFAALFGLGFLVMMFAPTRMKNIEAEIRAEPVKSGLAGLLGLLASIPLTLLMVVTVVGIPVAAVMWLLVGLTMMMGFLALANAIGSKLPAARLRRTQAVVLAVGLLALMLISLIPVIGPLVISAATFVSLGAIIRTRAGQRMIGMPVPDSLLHDARVG